MVDRRDASFDGQGLEEELRAILEQRIAGEGDDKGTSGLRTSRNLMPYSRPAPPARPDEIVRQAALDVLRSRKEMLKELITEAAEEAELKLRVGAETINRMRGVLTEFGLNTDTADTVVQEVVIKLFTDSVRGVGQILDKGLEEESSHD